MEAPRVVVLSGNEGCFPGEHALADRLRRTLRHRARFGAATSAQDIAEADVLVFDGLPPERAVRTLRRGGARVIVGLGRLPSRALSRLSAVPPPLPLGAIDAGCPGALAGIPAHSPAGQWLLGCRSRRLCQREAAVMALADDVIVASDADAEALAMNESLSCRLRARVWVSPPLIDPVRGPALRAPLRFVHVAAGGRADGGMAVRALARLWRRLDIPCPLHVFGWDRPEPGIDVHSRPALPGELYDGRSVLLQPVLVPGGVRAEVLAAFAHGAPVVGTPYTFEGLDLSDYPLCFADEAQMAALLEGAGQSLDLLLRAARQGWECVRSRYDPAAFAEAWERLLIRARPPAGGRVAPVTGSETG